MSDEHKAKLAAGMRAWKEAGGVIHRTKREPEHTIRTKHGGTVKIEKYSPNKAIKYFCTYCFCWEGDPKKECPDPLCPLYPYRGRKVAKNEAEAVDVDDEDGGTEDDNETEEE